MTPSPYTPILFLHIPKTAGTSLSAYLQTHYAPRDTELHIENHVLGKPKHAFQFLNSKYLLSAHLKFDTLIDSLEIDRFFTITLLRDPIKQTLSHLSWMKQIGFPENRAKYERYPTYIREIVDRMHTLDWEEYFATMNPHEKNFFDNCQTRYLLPSYGDTELDVAALSVAVRNLQRINLVGTIENYDRFLLLLAFYMGWRPPKKAPRKNISRARYTINPEAEGEAFQSYLEQLTCFDKKLYENAKEIFKREAQNAFQFARVRYPRLASIGLAQSDADWDALAHFLSQRSTPPPPASTWRTTLSKVKRFIKTKNKNTHE